MIGGIIHQSKKVNTNYTVVEQDEIVYVDTTNGNVTLTLELPTNDNLVHIKKVSNDANTVTITGTIDGSSNYTLTADNNFVTLVYFIDGSNSEFKVINTKEAGATGGLPSDYKIVAGVLRNTGGGWDTLIDGQHEPLNIDSVTNNTSAITVDYTSIGATKVLTSLIVPDETFVGVYNTGVSVGLTSANIQLRHETRIGKALITHTGSGNFTIANQEGSAFTGLSVSYNPVNGILDINHDSAKGTPHLHDWGGNTVFRKAVNTESYTQERVKLWKYDNTQQTLANPEVLRFNFERIIEVKVGAVDPNTVVSAGGNFWFMAILKV